MLVVALQEGTAWLMQTGLEAWSVSGLCTPQQDRMRIGCSSQGDDVGCCTECLALNVQGTRAAGVSFCAERTGVGKAGKQWL